MRNARRSWTEIRGRLLEGQGKRREEGREDRKMEPRVESRLGNRWKWGGARKSWSPNFAFALLTGKLYPNRNSHPSPVSETDKTRGGVSPQWEAQPSQTESTLFPILTHKGWFLIPTISPASLSLSLYRGLSPTLIDERAVRNERVRWYFVSALSPFRLLSRRSEWARELAKARDAGHLLRIRALSAPFHSQFAPCFAGARNWITRVTYRTTYRIQGAHNYSAH